MFFLGASLWQHLGLYFVKLHPQGRVIRGARHLASTPRALPAPINPIASEQVTNH